MLGGREDGHRELLVDGDYGAFEQMLDRTLGDILRADENDAFEMWGALANVDWCGPNGESVGYSFRAAGDLLAAIRRDQGHMTYMYYYCSVPAGHVSEWIAQALAAQGWRYETLS